MSPYLRASLIACFWFIAAAPALYLVPLSQKKKKDVGPGMRAPTSRMMLGRC